MQRLTRPTSHTQLREATGLAPDALACALRKLCELGVLRKDQDAFSYQQYVLTGRPLPAKNTTESQAAITFTPLLSAWGLPQQPPKRANPHRVLSS